MKPIVLFTLLLLSHVADASVVMLNTRVIYPSHLPSQAVQFTNNDAIPYVMQLWTDMNNPASTPDNADGPFVIMPALFRIEPNMGQSARLVYSGKNLRQDRESVFYLNTAQVPPKNILAQTDNQMVVVLRNRVKIFYRPRGIEGTPDEMPNQLQFSLYLKNDQWMLNVNNPTGYYASIIKANAVLTNKKVIAFHAEMVPPMSEMSFTGPKDNIDISSVLDVEFTLINDHGGYTEIKKPFKK